MNGLVAKPQMARIKWLFILGVSLIVGFGSICAFTLWIMAQKDYQHAREAATNLTTSVASEIDRNIESYDLSLQAVTEGLNLPEIDQVSPSVRQVILFDRSTTAKDLGSIQVLDAAGDVKLDSRTLSPRPGNFANRDFFRIHQMETSPGLFISAPWVTPDGEYLISLSRRITARDGSFRGVVVGSVSLSYFHDLFRKLHFGPKDSMVLLNRDGAIVMRVPFNVERIGQSIRNSLVFRYLPHDQSGAYTNRSVLDGIDRLYVFQQVGTRPLIISEGLALDGVYAGWRQHVRLIGSAIAALAVFTIIVMLYLATVLKRQAVAENALALLASTDGLTNLGNRRHFDKTLATEWRRGQRVQTPISLLMIDVDHFKVYNDTYGHQAGDAALATVARCLANSARRGSDLAARYGGEEFSVLLPGAALPAALETAQQIRDELALARETQPDLPTVSIGIACMLPGLSFGEDDLIRVADLALYEAKHSGRDCISYGADLPSWVDAKAA